MSLLVFVLYCLGYRGKGIPFILPTLYHFGHKIFHLYNPIAHPINHRIWDGWIVLSGIMTIAFSLYVYCFRTMCFTNLFFDIVSKEYKAATKRLKKETHQHLFHLSIVSGFSSYFVAINRWSNIVGVVLYTKIYIERTLQLPFLLASPNILDRITIFLNQRDITKIYY